MRYIKTKRRIIRATNAVDPATTTSVNFGFKPVPNKGGKTTNFEIPEGMFKRELEEMINGILDA
jgi:hypothetical protein